MNIANNYTIEKKIKNKKECVIASSNAKLELHVNLKDQFLVIKIQIKSSHKSIEKSLTLLEYDRVSCCITSLRQNACFYQLTLLPSLFPIT